MHLISNQLDRTHGNGALIFQMFFLQQSVLRPSFEDKPTWRVPPEEIINNEEWMKHVRTV
jgi:hypothetical protein